ncbi:chaperone [Gracilaria domingensis]|nr:chaperone [Gracilaria domingensis]
MVLARKEKANLRKRSSTNRREYERNPGYGTSDSNEREFGTRARPEVETLKRKKSGAKRLREEEICNKNLRRTEKRKRIKTFDDSENDIREHHVSSTSSTSSSISERSRDLGKASRLTDSSSSSTSRKCSHGTFADDEKQRIESIAASKEPIMPRTLKKVVRRNESSSSASSSDHDLQTDTNKYNLVTKKRKLVMKKPKMRFKATNHASNHSPTVTGEGQPRPKKSRKTKVSQSTTTRSLKHNSDLLECRKKQK